MPENKKACDMLIDFVTGKRVANIGVEEHRQRLERFLVNEKGYPKEEIGVDVDLAIEVGGELYRSQLDLVLSIDGRRFMVIKCVAGSLESRQREVLAAARVLDAFPVPYAAASDGRTAVVYDTASGKKIGEGRDCIPSYSRARKILNGKQPAIIPDKRIEKEKIIFRSYDRMNVNVKRNIHG